jgi:hypothetical protein
MPPPASVGWGPMPAARAIFHCARAPLSLPRSAPHIARLPPPLRCFPLPTPLKGCYRPPPAGIPRPHPTPYFSSCSNVAPVTSPSSPPLATVLPPRAPPPRRSRPPPEPYRAGHSPPPHQCSTSSVSPASALFAHCSHLLAVVLEPRHLPSAWHSRCGPSTRPGWAGFARVQQVTVPSVRAIFTRAP